MRIYTTSEKTLSFLDSAEREERICVTSEMSRFCVTSSPSMLIMTSSLNMTPFNGDWSLTECTRAPPLSFTLRISPKRPGGAVTMWQSSSSKALRPSPLPFHFCSLLPFASSTTSPLLLTASNWLSRRSRADRSRLTAKEEFRLDRFVTDPMSDCSCLRLLADWFICLILEEELYTDKLS